MRVGSKIQTVIRRTRRALPALVAPRRLTGSVWRACPSFPLTGLCNSHRENEQGSASVVQGARDLARRRPEICGGCLSRVSRGGITPRKPLDQRLRSREPRRLPNTVQQAPGRAGRAVCRTVRDRPSAHAAADRRCPGRARRRPARTQANARPGSGVLQLRPCPEDRCPSLATRANSSSGGLAYGDFDASVGSSAGVVRRGSR